MIARSQVCKSEKLISFHKVFGYQTSKLINKMGDFLPGYVFTMGSSHFPKMAGNIIVVGKENGKIYGAYADKAAFFAKLAERKCRLGMICYYRNMTFSPYEEQLAFNRDVWLMDEVSRRRLASSVDQMNAIIYA